MGNNLNKNYYEVLKISSNCSEEEIRTRIIEIRKELNDKNYSLDYFDNMNKLINECEDVLLNKANRNSYDELHGYNKVKSTDQEESIKVLNVEKNTKTAESGKKAVVTITTMGLVIIVLGSVIAGRLWSDKVKSSKKTNVIDSIAISETLASVNNSSTAMTTENNSSSTIASTEVDSIDIVSSDIWNEVKALQNEDNNYAPNLAKNNIINLVRWARHNGVVISNKEAFGQLMDLASKPEFNIAEFTKGTDDYENLNSFIECYDGVEQNNTLTDEDQCIKKIVKSDLNKDSVVTANIVLAEQYTKINQNFELDMATNMFEGIQDANLTKTLNTLSKEEIMNNYKAYNEFINYFNNAIDKSDEEDSSLKR